MKWAPIRLRIFCAPSDANDVRPFAYDANWSKRQTAAFISGWLDASCPLFVPWPVGKCSDTAHHQQQHQNRINQRPNMVKGSLSLSLYIDCAWYACGVPSFSNKSHAALLMILIRIGLGASEDFFHHPTDARWRIMKCWPCCVLAAALSSSNKITRTGRWMMFICGPVNHRGHS